MNDIQKDYLIGLVLKKLRGFDQNALQEVNINNNEFYQNIEMFVEKCANNLTFTHELFDFQNDDNEMLLTSDNINVEKVGLFISVKMNDKVFTISQDDFRILLISILCYMCEYLPLGSVVKIKEDDKESIVVIEQRMVHPKGKDYYIDYRAIPYPMGIFNEQMYLYFSAKDIVEVVSQGYSDFENEGYELALKESLIDNNVYSKDYQNNKQD